MEECDEAFRGPYAFSEPETQAIKSLVESEPTITSAMNFHSFGNMWLHPFNYLREAGKYPRGSDPNLVKFYQSFKKKVQEVSVSMYGTAIETVNYYTDGEASDWMFGEHGIIAFSPELGTNNHQTDDFKISRELINDVLDENYKVIELFIKMNEFTMSNLSYGFNNRKRLFIEFENTGLADIYSSTFKLEASNDLLLDAVSAIHVHPRVGEKVNVSIAKSDDKYSGIIEVPSILRLQKFRIIFEFNNPTIDLNQFELNIQMKMSTGFVFGNMRVVNYGKNFNSSQLFSMFVIVLLCLVSVMIFLAQKIWKKRLNLIAQPENTAVQTINNNVLPPELTVQLSTDAS